MNDLLQRIKDGLVVSCQAEGNSPFNSPEGVSMFAQAAVQGGASGIRSEGIEKTKKIIATVPLPVIGLVKSSFDDGYVRITGSFKDVEDLISIGTPIIAIDGTFRLRENLSGPDFIAQVKQKYHCTVMADIATEQEAIACAAAGADCVSTTLSGYTPETRSKSDEPNYELLGSLVQKLSIPVIAEGRVNTPEIALKMRTLGAWSIVVGSAITRPTEITKWYVQSMKSI
jgi:N-acylglucosamine-6-phosphate 2-epimerase